MWTFALSSNHTHMQGNTLSLHVSMVIVYVLRLVISYDLGRDISLDNMPGIRLLVGRS